MLKAKHQQLFDILAQEFHNGKWPRGKKLPKLKVLAEKYSVSINIASKAVDLLKNEGMVEAKVGDGIYSTYKMEIINKYHYSGDRIFGRYRGAKTLKILVEDNSPNQLIFWNDFFQNFSAENPDIELDVNYQIDHSDKDCCSYGAVFGGFSFVRSVIEPDNEGLSPECVRDFLPNLFGDCVFDENNFPGYLPYGYNAPLLLVQPECHFPAPDENILEYVENLPATKQGYIIRSSKMLLSGMNIDTNKIGTDDFTKEDAELMLSVFERTKRLYRAGKLLWYHGKVLDKQQLFELLLNHNISAMEVQSNTLKDFSAEMVNVLPYPYGEKPCITAHFVHISKDTLYPEEYLRLVKMLLSEKIQKKAEEQGIFYTIRKNCSSMAPENLRKSLLNNNVQLPDICTDIQAEAFLNFLGWEFYYYLEGRRGPEVIDLIHKKVRYYYEHNNQTGK